MKQADQGSLTKAQLSKLISNHCDLAHSACKQALEVLKQHGLKIQRVCIKLNVSHEIFTIADQQEAKCTCGDRVRAVETIFWRLLWNVHINYAALKSRDGLRTVRGNADLKEKPRFLAIGSFKRIDPPESFVTIAEVLEKKASSDLTPPSDHRKQAESFWLELRKLIADRYDSCIGVMIGGPPEFSDPLIDGPKSESTRLSIGFIGLDSKDPEIIHLLEQDDLEAVAAMADALYPALRNLKTFMEAYQTVEKALAKGASLPATTTPTP